MKYILNGTDYKIDANGDIFSTLQGALRLIRPQTTSKGYRAVVLRHKGRYIRRYVHRLVAQAYIPNPRDLPTVNHKNGVKDDNRVNNLEWASWGDNHRHAYKELNRVPANSRKTHCPAGHEYTEDNTYYSRGWRSCKKCKSIKYVERRRL